MVKSGPKWAKLIKHEQYWLKLVEIGRKWPNSAEDGQKFQKGSNETQVGNIGPTCGENGQTWPKMVNILRKWSRLNTFNISKPDLSKAFACVSNKSFWRLDRLSFR